MTRYADYGCQVEKSHLSNRVIISIWNSDGEDATIYVTPEFALEFARMIEDVVNDRYSE